MNEYNIAHALFNLVFKNDNNIGQLSNDYKYKGTSFDDVKNNYQSMTLVDLRDALYLYSIHMEYFNRGTIHYFHSPHKNKVEDVIKYIEYRIDDLEDSDSEEEKITDDQILKALKRLLNENNSSNLNDVSFKLNI